MQVLENWEAQQDNEAIFDVDMHNVDGKPFVRVTFPDGKEGTICGFDTRAGAIKGLDAKRLFGFMSAGGN